MSSSIDFSAFNYAVDIEIRFADMDALGHVNNAVYLTYFEMARTKYWQDVVKWDWKTLGIIIARAEIDYVSQLTVRDRAKMYIRTSRVGNTSFDLEYALVRKGDDGSELLAAKGMTVCVVFDYEKQKPSPIPSEQRSAMETDTIENIG